MAKDIVRANSPDEWLVGDLRDLFEATTEAGKRTRTVMVIAIIASVLVFAGLLNSLSHSWLHERLIIFGNPESKYVKDKMGALALEGFASKSAPYTPTLASERYLRFYQELSREYIASAFSIHIPVLGFTVDVNDLGIIGGIAFMSILLVYWFCLLREYENTVVLFEAAKTKRAPYHTLYKVLAMRQVFTVPQMFHQSMPYKMLRRLAKTICFLPVITHASVTIHDFFTHSIGESVSPTHTLVVYFAESTLTVTILILCSATSVCQRRLEHLWDQNWETIKKSAT